MGLFKKKVVVQSYDKENKKPVIKSSICNGEQVAGFKDIHTGKFEEVMLIKNPADKNFCKNNIDTDFRWENDDSRSVSCTFFIQKTMIDAKGG